ncbi:HSP20-like chaperone [Echria macrotheca]|uniref:HSP20-like chaperone n=1 Tax=Echria macrotheca TaxID=438768 RepID=A0AAJ0BIJ4_9PEZI|nr:HSP20-like chaperone [Echria macrotheca]
MSWSNPPLPPLPPLPPAPPGSQAYFRSFAQPAAGYGTDQTAPEHGFQFGPGGFRAWSGPHGVDGNWGQWAGPWGFGVRGRGGWRGGRSHSHGRRGRREGNNSGEDEDMHDVAVAAAAAEAEMEAAEAEKEAAEAAREAEMEKDASPGTMRDADGDHPDPPEEAPRDRAHRHHHGFRGRGGRFGRCRRDGRGHRNPGPHSGPHSGPYGGPYGGWFPFGPAGHPGAASNMPDFWAMIEQYGPRAREYIERVLSYYGGQQQSRQANNDNADAGDDGSSSFTPPIDVFDTADNWTVHVALPGARKEDMGVNWDAARSLLTISGVVHRPGDEGFLRSMVSGERRVGLFERTVQLPPPTAAENETKEEVDGDNITARMEDGILIVVVPKVEKEWTEIRKVDIN